MYVSLTRSGPNPILCLLFHQYQSFLRSVLFLYLLLKKKLAGIENFCAFGIDAAAGRGAFGARP